MSSTLKFLVYGCAAATAVASSLPSSNSSATRAAVKEFPECTSLHQRKSWYVESDLGLSASLSNQGLNPGLP